MRAIKGALLGAACMVGLCPSMSAAQGQDEFQINRLFVVGDSLSDSGTYSNVVRAAPVFQTAAGIAEAIPTLVPGILAANPALTIEQATGLATQQAIGAALPLPGQQLPTDGLFHFTNDSPAGNTEIYTDVIARNLGIEVQPNLVTGIPFFSIDPATLPAGSEAQQTALLLQALIATDPEFAALANDIEVGGTSFAQGGARVALPGEDAAARALGGISQTPVTVQVDRLLASTPSFNDTDLVVIWAGNNDVLDEAAEVGAGAITPADAFQSVTQAANQLTEQVDRVLAHGPATVVVVTVPDIGTSTPLGAAASDEGAALLSGLSSTFNSTLSDGVSGRVSLVNSGLVLQEVLDNAEAFGFSAPDQLGALACAGDPASVSALTCLNGINTSADAGELIFADSVHPSAATQNILGQLAFNIFPGVGQVGVMPVATITGLRQQSIGLETRLNLGAFFIGDKEDHTKRVRREVGHVEVYGGAELGFYNSDAQPIVPGFDAETQVLKAAADIMVTENVLLGIGGSLDHGQIDFDEGRGGFDERLFVGALFGVAQIVPGVYVNGILGGGFVDVIDIERNFDVSGLDGSLLNRQRFEADTDGTYFVARSNVGAVIPLGKGFFVNPSLGFGYERVDLDGYQESAVGGSLSGIALEVGDLDFESWRGTAALAGFYRPPSAPDWTFGLRASWEEDFNNDDLLIPFATGGTALNTQAAPRPDDSYGFLSANIVKDFGPNSALTLSASTNFEQAGVNGNTISLVYKYTF